MAAKDICPFALFYSARIFKLQSRAGNYDTINSAHFSIKLSHPIKNAVLDAGTGQNISRNPPQGLRNLPFCRQWKLFVKMIIDKAFENWRQQYLRRQIRLVVRDAKPRVSKDMNHSITQLWNMPVWIGLFASLNVIRLRSLVDSSVGESMSNSYRELRRSSVLVTSPPPKIGAIMR